MFKMMKKQAEPYDEMGHLAARGGRPYSLGHRRMYLGPAQLLAEAKVSVLEVGFGIGFGLTTLLNHDVCACYEGVEIDRRCFEAVLEWAPKDRNIRLTCSDWVSAPVLGGVFDHCFCIEVIEHVDPDQAAAFLGKIRRHARTLWLSTPEQDRSDHGIYTRSEMRGLLAAAGFTAVTVHAEQWTTLYVAQ